MHLAIMVGTFVQQDGSEWHPSTLLPTMADGYLVLRDVFPEFHNIVTHTERHVQGGWEMAPWGQRSYEGALSHGARTVHARCAHGSMFLGWLPNLYPVEWPP